MTTMPVTLQERIPVPINAPGGPSSAGPAISASDIIRILKQRIFLIIFVWFFVTALVTGLTFYLDKYYRLYTAQSVVLVISPNPKTPLEMGTPMVQVELMNRYVADQAVLVSEEGVLRLAMADAEITNTSWYQSEPDKGELLDDLTDDLGVAQIPNTSFLLVKFSTREKEDGPKIVNTIIKHYLGKVRTMSLQQYKGERDIYKQELAQLESRLDRIREDKQVFIASFSVPGVTEGLNIVGETFRTLAAEVTRLEAEGLQFKAAADNLRGLDPTEIAISPQSRLMIQQDPQVAALNNQVIGVRQERKITLGHVGQNHRSIQMLDIQLSAMEEEFDRLMLEKEDEVREYQLSSAETAYLNAFQAEMQLRERLLDEQAKQEDIDRKLAQFRSLEDEQMLLEAQHGQLYGFVNQLELVTNDQQSMVRVHQINPAVLPREPSFPKPLIFIPAGAFLGLMLGVGLAILLELVDTSIKTSRDLSRHVHIPILGTVPDVDDEEVDIDKIELAAHTHPRSMVAEAFRAIRTNLLLSSPAERQRTLLITSAKPEEGRTAVAINLAISIAQSGRRVLLIDSNFHRPAIQTVFPNGRREGLSNALVGQAGLDELVSQTDLPNLDVMTSGPIPPNPTELLAGSYMRDLIVQAKERYDQIIFDGPPVLLVSDALVMAGIVDGIIMVCRAKVSSRGVVQRGRDQIERVNGHIFGAVLNAAQISRGGYFREQIRSYYEYQPAETLQGGGTPILPTEGGNRDDPADQ